MGGGQCAEKAVPAHCALRTAHQKQRARRANAGPSDATGVTLADTWPAGFTRGTVTPSQGTCANVGSGPDFTCSLGTIAAAGAATVTVNYTVPSSTTD